MANQNHRDALAKGSALGGIANGKGLVGVPPGSQAEEVARELFKEDLRNAGLAYSDDANLDAVLDSKLEGAGGASVESEEDRDVNMAEDGLVAQA